LEAVSDGTRYAMSRLTEAAVHRPRRAHDAETDGTSLEGVSVAAYTFGFIDVRHRDAAETTP